MIMDNVWKWLGFSQKINAKIALEKYFTIENDYKCLLLLPQEQKKEGRGGHNKQDIFYISIKQYSRTVSIYITPFVKIFKCRPYYRKRL